MSASGTPSEVQLPVVIDATGKIGIIEPRRLGLPLSIERVYYLFDLPRGSERGSHAHKSLVQILVAIHGSFTVWLDDGLGLRTAFHLDAPTKGLLVPPGFWRDIESTDEQSILLVMASQEFSESDYLRDYEGFRQWKTAHPSPSSH